MAKIFFPYVDRPKKFPFLLGRDIRFPFIIDDLVYYWTLNAEGITLYLHNDKATAFKDIVLEDTGITFYLSNGSVGTKATLAKALYIEFEQIGKGIHTLGRLDPLTLNNIDLFTLGEITDASANWKALRDAVVTAVSNIASKGDDLQMRLSSNAIVTAEKAIFTGELSSFIYATGLRKQRIMALGELDPHVLEDIDMMLATFRAFGDVPASAVKYIGVTNRKMLQSALSESKLRKEAVPSEHKTALLSSTLTIEISTATEDD